MVEVVVVGVVVGVVEDAVEARVDVVADEDEVVVVVADVVHADADEAEAPCECDSSWGSVSLVGRMKIHTLRATYLVRGVLIPGCMSTSCVDVVHLRNV